MVTRPENAPEQPRRQTAPDERATVRLPAFDARCFTEAAALTRDLARCNTSETMGQFPKVSINDGKWFQFSGGDSSATQGGIRPDNAKADAAPRLPDAKILESGNSSVAEKTAAAARLFDTLPKDANGRAHVKLQDGKTEKDFEISVKTVAPGVHVNALFVKDEAGKEHPVMRWVDRHGKFEQQSNASGKSVGISSDYASQNMHEGTVARFADKAPDKGPGKAPDKGSDKAPDKGSDKAPDKGSDKAPDKGSDRAPDKGSDKAPDKGPGRAPDKGPGAGPDHGPDRAPEKTPPVIPPRPPRENDKAPEPDRRGEDPGAMRAPDVVATLPSWTTVYTPRRGEGGVHGSQPPRGQGDPVYLPNHTMQKFLQDPVASGYAAAAGDPQTANGKWGTMFRIAEMGNDNLFKQNTGMTKDQWTAKWGDAYKEKYGFELTGVHFRVVDTGSAIKGTGRVDLAADVGTSSNFEAYNSPDVKHRFTMQVLDARIDPPPPPSKRR